MKWWVDYYWIGSTREKSTGKKFDPDPMSECVDLIQFIPCSSQTVAWHMDHPAFPHVLSLGLSHYPERSLLQPSSWHLFLLQVSGMAAISSAVSLLLGAVACCQLRCLAPFFRLNAYLHLQCQSLANSHQKVRCAKTDRWEKAGNSYIYIFSRYYGNQYLRISLKEQDFGVEESGREGV